MANNLNNLIPIIYMALDIVAREMVGFTMAAFRNSNADRVALGQTVNYPIVPAIVTGDIVPAPIPPDDGDMAVGNGTLTISKSKYAPIKWTGEEQKAVSQTGIMQNVIIQQFAQGIRALVNLIEIDLAALYTSASRAVGTAGNAPFGTAGDFSDFANSLQVLDDNGAPLTDRQLVLGSAAIANVRGKQSVLFKINEAGTADLLRQGIIGRVEGFDIHTSAQVPVGVAKGTGAGYVVNFAAGYPVGATAITVGTGSGTILAGDTVTFAGDTNRYVTTGLSGTTLTLALPGLKKPLANTVAVTVGGNYTPNMFFVREAVHLLTRLPAMPEGGDDADDVTEITDPVSGLVFQVALYRQYRRIRYELGIAWGVKVVKPDFVGLLLG